MAAAKETKEKSLTSGLLELAASLWALCFFLRLVEESKQYNFLAMVYHTNRKRSDVKGEVGAASAGQILATSGYDDELLLADAGLARFAVVLK
jgi:hypothetical protein